MYYAYLLRLIFGCWYSACVSFGKDAVAEMHQIDLNQNGQAFNNLGHSIQHNATRHEI